MFVVTVIPITRQRLKESLSFFAKRAVPVGAVIDVPVRGKPIPALVAEVADVRDEKLALRSKTYSLKKISPKSVRSIFPERTVDAFKNIAEWHALPLGAVIARLSPSAVLTAPAGDALRARGDDNTWHGTDESKTTSDALVLQAEYDDRVRLYRSIAREAFARGQSLLITSPTIAEAERLYEKLHRGIKEHTFILTSAETKKNTLAAWKRAVEEPEPLLIIATHSFISIPRHGLDAIIVERESARSYVSQDREALDTRVAAEHIARKSGARIIFADFPVRIETRARLQAGELEELSRLQVSVQRGAAVRLINTRTKKEVDAAPPVKKKRFSAFSDEVKGAIDEALARGVHVFLYAARRGLAPLTVCNDCGTPVTDPATGVPMTLQKTESGNVFLSYRSGAVMPANTSCRACGSWNLVSLGIGVERVLAEAEKLFPEIPIISLTADSAPTHTKAKGIRKRFYDMPGALLVGTERALPYLNTPVALSVVMSIDSMLSISAWRAHEYALQALFYLKDRTKTLMLVQTRQPESEVMTAIASGNPTEFVRSELAERKRFGYPPYATFIGLSWSGTERAVHKTADAVQAALGGFDVVGPLPARQVAPRRFQARAVVRLAPGRWPDNALRAALAALPREVSVVVDPDEII